MRVVTFLALVLSIRVAGGAEADPPPDGQAIFYSNCAVCHGMDGSGGRGPNLLGTLQNGDRDSDIASVVRHGIPGSSMRAFHLGGDELNALIKHIQTLRQGAPSPTPRGGDKVAGELLYRTHGCAGCHRIGTAGSTFGPDLTRIGATRSYEYLKASVLNPSVDVPDQFKAVTVVTQNGKHIRGIRVNEDTFTIQLRLPDESFVSFDKQSVRSLVHEIPSFMPVYQFSGNDLQDLLSYLSSLTGHAAASGTPQQPDLR